VVTKLLQRANVGTATEIAEFSNTKRSSMEKYLKCKAVYVYSPFFN